MNNWVFSPNILQELSVTISETEIYSIIYAIFHGSPTVYKYDTNSVVSMSDHQNTSNYNQMLFGSSSRVGRVFCFYWQERFYIGIKDGGRLLVVRLRESCYYTPCKMDWSTILQLEQDVKVSLVRICNSNFIIHFQIQFVLLVPTALF